jgi:hypothetical protein
MTIANQRRQEAIRNRTRKQLRKNNCIQALSMMFTNLISFNNSSVAVEESETGGTGTSIFTNFFSWVNTNTGGTTANNSTTAAPRNRTPAKNTGVVPGGAVPVNPNPYPNHCIDTEDGLESGGRSGDSFVTQQQQHHQHPSFLSLSSSSLRTQHMHLAQQPIRLQDQHHQQAEENTHKVFFGNLSAKFSHTQGIMPIKTEEELAVAEVEEIQAACELEDLLQSLQTNEEIDIAALTQSMSIKAKGLLLEEQLGMSRKTTTRNSFLNIE